MCKIAVILAQLSARTLIFLCHRPVIEAVETSFMKQYFVEGIVVPRRVKGRSKNNGPERVSVAVWAETPKDALIEARKTVDASEWIEGPTLALSEEERMRAEGAPELFDYAAVTKKSASK
jgi:hypothetical protein